MYKPTDVFLNAEDSAKIALYIAIPEGWEWWYARLGRSVWFLRKIDGMYIDTSAPEAIDERIIKEENILLTPAIDCGLLDLLFKTEPNFWKGLTMLENMRDAAMHLIDNNLIQKVKEEPCK